MRNPLVSVIIPVHNGEQFLGEAIASVLAQDYAPIELIVIDDGSTDASAQLVKGLGPQVHYFYQPNAGTGAARNIGVTLSQGEYLAFLDQDDVWESGKLTWQIDALTKSTYWDAVFGYIEIIRSPEVAGHNGSTIPPLRNKRPAISPSGILLKRKAFEQIGPFDVHLKIAEWVDWYIRAIDYGLRMKMAEFLVAKRRIHEKNKGRLFHHYQKEYVQVLKASLDRRKTFIQT